MISEPNQKRRTTEVDAPSGRIHALIAALEVQLQSGQLPEHLEISTAENSMPKVLSSEREEPAFY